jgi:PAS domain S-box-containing protein
MSSSIVLPGEKVHEIFESVPAIIWSADPHTLAFTYVNGAAETILGYPQRQWIEQPDFWARHIHPDDCGVIATCREQVAAGKNHELVYRMITAGGGVVWLRDMVRVRMDAGRVVYIFGTMFDITTEQAIIEDLARSEENYRRLVDASPDAIGVHVDGRYIYVNVKFVELFGAKSKDELIGRDVLSLVSPVFHDMIRERHRELAKGITVPVMRQQYIRFDGRLADVEVMAVPIVFNGTPAIHVIARDITGRLQTEERLQLLAAGTNEAIWEANLETGEFWANDVYRQRFGTYTKNEAAKQAWTERVHPDDRARIASLIRVRTTSPLLRWSDEYRVRLDDGTWAWILARGRTVVDENGRPIRLIGALLDVTDKNLLQRRLEDARRVASLGHLAASIAHEFNNVLMSIQPFAEILVRTSPRTEQSAKAHKHIMDAVARGKRVTSEILLYANPKDPQPQPIDIDDALKGMVASLQQTLPPEVALVLETGSPMRILCDPYDLEHVITNLVNNARDAMPEGGVITIQTCSDGDEWRGRTALHSGLRYARVTVNDTGCGIAAAALPSIFEPLFTTKRTGTGLGLPIAKNLIERQNGAILVDTAEGEGTTFHLFLPLAM